MIYNRFKLQIEGKKKKLRGKCLTQCYQSCSNRGLDLEDPPSTSLDLSRSTFKNGLDLANPPANCKKKKVAKKNDALNAPRW